MKRINRYMLVGAAIFLANSGLIYSMSDNWWMVAGSLTSMLSVVYVALD